MANPPFAGAVHVLDVNKHVVKPNHDYYVVSSDDGGYINLHSSRNAPCPLDVVHDSPDATNKRKIRFSPTDNSHSIWESTDQTLKFTTSIPTCNEEPVWKADYDVSLRKWFITTGGDDEDTFQLERIGTSLPPTYKIISTSGDGNKSVGISSVNNAQRLVLVDGNEKVLSVHIVPGTN